MRSIARHWWMLLAVVLILTIWWGTITLLHQEQVALLDGLVPPEAHNVTYADHGLARGSVRYEPGMDHADFAALLARIGWQHTWQTDDRLVYTVTILTQAGDAPLETITILTRQRFGVLTDSIELYQFYGAHPLVAMYVQRCLHIHQWTWCG